MVKLYMFCPNISRLLLYINKLAPTKEVLDLQSKQTNKMKQTAELF